MAKTIQFKRVQENSRVNDAAGIFRTFPGSGGSFSAETADITDTILGQTFESNERGLIDWSVSTDGIYKGYPGYTCRISRATTEKQGTNLATTRLTSSGTAGETKRVAGEDTTVWGFRINDKHKRVLKRPGIGETAKDIITLGGNVTPSGGTSRSADADDDIALVDYLSGIVWLKNVNNGNITVTAKYYDMESIARATDYTLTLSVTMRDETNFTESSLNGSDPTLSLGTGNGEIEFTTKDRYSGDKSSRYPGFSASIVISGTDTALYTTYNKTTRTITINSATDSTGAATSTAKEAVTELNAIDDLVNDGVVITYGGVGTKVLEAASKTNFSGGWTESAPTDDDDPDARGGFMLYSPGLRTVGLSMSGVTVPTRKFSSELDFRQALLDREELLIEVNPDGIAVGTGDDDGVGFRSWMKFASASEEGDVGQTQTTSLEFTLTVPYDEEIPTPVALVGNIKRLPEAVLDAVDSWLNEEYQNEVRYLPSGSTDGTGIEGKVVISDLTLSGGLTAMNVFNVEMMGNGRYKSV